MAEFVSSLTDNKPVSDVYLQDSALTKESLSAKFIKQNVNHTNRSHTLNWLQQDSANDKERNVIKIF